MRAHVNLSEGTVSAEYPIRPVGFTQAVKCLSGERVELGFFEDGTALLLPTGTSLRLSVRNVPGGTLLAEQTSFTAPGDASGYYTARISFNTDPVLAMLAANPARNVFAAVGEFAWLVPGASDWEISDSITFSLMRAVGAGSDPVALTSPYAWLKAVLVAGANVTLTPDDEAETITVSASEPPFYIDRVSEDGAFLIVKNAEGADVGKVAWFDL